MSKLPDIYTAQETIDAMVNAAAEEGEDYKALVAVFFFGAVDSHQMVVPLSGNNRTIYETARPVPTVGIATDEEPILDLNVDPEWRLHPQLSTFHEYWQANNMAVVFDVGTLNKFITRQEYFSDPTVRPESLFSHNTQQDLWQAALPPRVQRTTGWFGRTSNLTDDYFNPEQAILFSSFSTARLLLQNFAFDNKVQYIVPPVVIGEGPRTTALVSADRWAAVARIIQHKDTFSFDVSSASDLSYPLSHYNLLFHSFRDNFNYSDILQRGVSALNSALPTNVANRFNALKRYRETATKRLIAGQPSSSYIRNNEGGYFNGSFTGGEGYAINDTITLDNGATVIVNSITSGGTIASFTIQTIGDDIFPGVVWNHNYSPPIEQDTTSGTGTGFSIKPNINNVTGDSGDNGYRLQFLNAFRTIYNRNNFKQKRQLIMVAPGSFDHHSNLRAELDYRLAEIDACIKSFKDSIQELGLQNNVTLFTQADFGRTLVSNGNNGTDHAWAGHHFVMGGGVKGGIYGEQPDYTLTGPRNTGNTLGRYIPRIPIEQYYSTLLLWYGIPEAQLPIILPNLPVFTNAGANTNIGFLDFVEPPEPEEPEEPEPVEPTGDPIIVTSMGLSVRDEEVGGFDTIHLYQNILSKHLVARGDTMGENPNFVTDAHYLITGNNFSTNCNVSVSGTGINVTSVSVHSNTTLFFTMDVDANADLGLRDVTVSLGANSNTLNDIIEVYRAGFTPNVAESRIGVTFEGEWTFFWPNGVSNTDDPRVNIFPVGSYDIALGSAGWFDYPSFSVISFTNTGITENSTITSAVLRQRTARGIVGESSNPTHITGSGTWPLTVNYLFKPAPNPTLGEYVFELSANAYSWLVSSADNNFSGAATLSVQAPEGAATLLGQVNRWTPADLNLTSNLQSIVNLSGFSGNRLYLLAAPENTQGTPSFENWFTKNLLWGFVKNAYQPENNKHIAARLFVNWE